VGHCEVVRIDQSTNLTNSSRNLWLTSPCNHPGGGFGGLWCAQNCRDADSGHAQLESTTITPSKPLLYKVATDELTRKKSVSHSRTDAPHQNITFTKPWSRASIPLSGKSRRIAFLR